jgi:hypothetical protein
MSGSIRGKSKNIGAKAGAIALYNGRFKPLLNPPGVPCQRVQERFRTRAIRAIRQKTLARRRTASLHLHPAEAHRSRHDGHGRLRAGRFFAARRHRRTPYQSTEHKQCNRFAHVVCRLFDLHNPVSRTRRRQ